jgi:hypothetical protein
MECFTGATVLDTLREIVVGVFKANSVFSAIGSLEGCRRTPAWLRDKTLNSVDIDDAKVFESGGSLGA